jgi:hypothetical protein
MKTLVTLMHGTVAKKHTFFRAKLELATVIGTKMWPACTPKNFEKAIVRWLMEEKLNGRLHTKKACGQAIDEITRSGESVAPKAKGHRSMG